MQMESKYLLKLSHFWELSDLKQNEQKTTRNLAKGCT